MNFLTVRRDIQTRLDLLFNHASLLVGSDCQDGGLDDSLLLQVIEQIELAIHLLLTLLQNFREPCTSAATEEWIQNHAEVQPNYVAIVLGQLLSLFQSGLSC